MSRYVKVVNFKSVPRGAGYYIIENIETGMAYVGSSRIVRDRLRAHYTDLCRSTHCSFLLQQDFDTYGLDGFRISHFLSPIEVARIQEFRGIRYYMDRSLSYNAVLPLEAPLHRAFVRSKLPPICLNLPSCSGVL